MPVILRNNTNSIEIDIHANLKYTVSKGGFDVIYEDAGVSESTPYVYVILRSASLIAKEIRLDWRDTTSPDAVFTSAEDLRDTLLSWNIMKVAVTESALPAGAATEATLSDIKDNQSNGSQVSQILQNVIADAGNSSDVNLAAGNMYSFLGTGKSTLGVAGIQVSLYADQNCTVYVKQSPDNVNWDLSDEFHYYAEENFGITVQAVSSYMAVMVVTASLTTTVFRLQTVLCPVVDAVPRALDDNGHFQTAIKSIKDLYNFGVENTPIGEMRVVIPTRLVGSNYEGTTLDPNFWSSSVANDGTVTQANAQAIIATNITSANGSAKLYSVRRARYIGGSSMAFRMIAKVTAGATDNKRRWGIAYGSTMPTISDGAYFELDGSVFSVVLMKGGVEDRVSSGDFNGHIGKTYENTLIVAKTYEIYWTNSKVYFVIGDEILHTFSATTDTWADTMNFYIYMDSVNSNGAQTNNVIYCRVASIRRLGQLLTQPTSKYQSGTAAGVVCKYGAGNLHSIVISAIVNNAAITLYDNTAASGTVIWASGAMAANTTPFSIDFKGLPFYIGLTLVIATANCNALLTYE